MYAAGGSLLVAGLGICAAIGKAITSTLDEFGVVDRRAAVGALLVSMLGAIAAALGSGVIAKELAGRRRMLPILAGLLTLVALGGLGWFVYADRPNAEYVEGELSADHPFAHRVLISGGNGYSYYVTFTQAGSLSAEIQLRGGGQPIAGVLTDNRVQVIEAVLAGDTTWTALLGRHEGQGKYLVFVDSAAPERLVINGQPMNRTLDVGRTRTGFVFEVSERQDHQSIFLSVKGRSPGQPNLGVVLRTDKGTPMANAPPGGDGTIFTTVSVGTYVVEVQGGPGQGFTLTLDNKNPKNPGQAPVVPAPDESALVPDVAGRLESEAVSRLSAAGFVVQSYPVCSNRLAAAKTPIGTTRQVVRVNASTGETEVISDTKVVVPSLPTGTRLDVKAFNGLACN
jgi:hypothetical protein